MVYRLRSRPPLSPDAVDVAIVELDRIHEAAVVGGIYELTVLARTLGRYLATPVGDAMDPKPLANLKYARALLRESCEPLGVDPTYLLGVMDRRAAEEARTE